MKYEYEKHMKPNETHFICIPVITPSYMKISQVYWGQANIQS